MSPRPPGALKEFKHSFRDSRELLCCVGLSSLVFQEDQSFKSFDQRRGCLRSSEDCPWKQLLDEQLLHVFTKMSE